MHLGVANKKITDNARESKLNLRMISLVFLHKAIPPLNRHQIFPMHCNGE